jgi:hypothetical protein
VARIAPVSIHEVVVSPGSGVVPFEPGTDGFYDAWWVDVSPEPSKRYFRFEMQGREVARAQVDEASTDFGDPPGQQPETVVKIEFFEVGEGWRGDGSGRAAVELLCGRYTGQLMTLISSESGAFWTQIGWAPSPPLQSAGQYADRYYTHLGTVDPYGSASSSKPD